MEFKQTQSYVLKDFYWKKYIRTRHKIFIIRVRGYIIILVYYYINILYSFIHLFIYIFRPFGNITSENLEHVPAFEHTEYVPSFENLEHVLSFEDPEQQQAERLEGRLASMPSLVRCASTAAEPKNDCAPTHNINK